MGMKTTRISSVDYLQSTVMVGDSAASSAFTERGLTAYYTESGNPPGKWIGASVSVLGLTEGDPITSQAAVTLWQQFRNPVNRELLGKPPTSETKSNAEPPDSQLAESTKQTSKDVAGFDLTFTIPKDASILWAISSPDVQAAINECHNAAVKETLRAFEEMALQTRIGHGGVGSASVNGLIAGQWDHWDSRDGEPHLHSHVVISNRAQRASDGAWVTLDSRSLFKNTVALSEMHQNLFMDAMHRRLGVQWELRSGLTSKAVVPDLVGMDAAVRELFSSRKASIEKERARRIAAFTARYDRKPNQREWQAIDNDAWRATRKPKPKEVAPLSQRCEQWRALATEQGASPASVVAACLGRESASDVSGATSEEVHRILAQLTLAAMSDQPGTSDQQRVATLAGGITASLTRHRSTWSMANVRAEVERTMRLVRASSPEARRTAGDLVTEAVLAQCIEINPQRYQVPDGADARLAHHGRALFDDINRAAWTSQSALDRENELLAALTTPDAFPAPQGATDALLEAINAAQTATKGFALAPDQDAAVRALLEDTARLSVLIGPAGTGKTTTMSALRTAWQQLHGEDSVLGLTTSAQAAHVLSSEIGSEAHTIAKWLYETTVGREQRTEQIQDLTGRLSSLPEDAHRPAGILRAQLAQLTAQQDTWTMGPGQLVIVDEASMTDAVHLQALTHQADAAGAKLLLVGDHRQLDAVDAGGALGMLAQTGRAVELTSVWRFSAQWEAEASLDLRSVRDTDEALALIDVYDAHDRLHHGEDDDMLDAAYTATRASLAEGRSSLLIASTNEHVHDLNERFRRDRRTAGEVDATLTAPLRGGADAGVGERIVARKNDRLLLDSAGDFIRNGSLLTVTRVHPDGSVDATREGSAATITLPAAYLEQHGELGYATTAHRSQGMTVDEARLVVPMNDAIPAELLYVGMTRGRHLNAAYIGEESAAETTGPGILIAAEDIPSWRGRLAGMMTTVGAAPSATQALQDAARDSDVLSRLISEYEYLASLEDFAPLRDQLARALGEDPTELEFSPVFSSLTAAWRAARAIDAGRATYQLQQPLYGVEDADIHQKLRLLTHRLRIVAPTPPAPSAGMIRGLTPRTRTSDPGVLNLARQVEDRITDRLATITSEARASQWAIDVPPQLIGHVAAYRDLYDVRGESTVLGQEPDARDTRQHTHWMRLTEILARSVPPTDPPATPSPTGQPVVSPEDPGPAPR